MREQYNDFQFELYVVFFGLSENTAKNLMKKVVYTFNNGYTIYIRLIISFRLSVFPVVYTISQKIFRFGRVLYVSKALSLKNAIALIVAPPFSISIIV